MGFLVIDKSCINKIFTDKDPEIECLEFNTKEEAEYYIKHGKIMNKGKDNEINVFTDGACSNNGYKNAKAGIGVYFGENDERNVSKSLQNLWIKGRGTISNKIKQTNNTAELLAVIEVFTILEKEINKNYLVNIYTDSEYVIKCCTSYGEKCEKNNWKKKNGEIPNVELVRKVYSLYKQFDNVKLEWIRAHTNKNDTLSKGNEGADKLANLSIEEECCPYSKIDKIIVDNTKIYINVPFENKDFAKEYGAKWDIHKKKWYYNNNLSKDNISILKEKFT